jgi:hypothetical protein
VTDDHYAAVEWLETVYHARLEKMPHANQHGFYSFREDSVQETPSQDAAHWPAQDGFRRLSLAGCALEPERWFVEFFFRGWHDEVAEQTPEATKLSVGPSVERDGVRERHRHAERQVQEDPVPPPRGEESLVLV